MKVGSVGVVFQGSVSQTLSDELDSVPDHFVKVVATWFGSEVQAAALHIPTKNIVLSPIPKFRGRANINLQKRSTIAGLQRLQELGVTYAWKIRSDFGIPGMLELTDRLLVRSVGGSKIFFLDWVLHKSGYPMDFIQFGKTEDLLKLWRGVRVTRWNRTAPEEQLKASLIRGWAAENFDHNAFKSVGFMASEICRSETIDVRWHKYGLSLRRDWVGNPVFVQLSGCEHMIQPDRDT